VALLFVTASAVLGQNGDEAIHQRLKKDIFFLASEECQGRGIDTEGIHKAAEYLANEFKQAGLKPGGKGGTYFQPFNVAVGAATLEGTNAVTLTGPQGQTIALQAGKDFQILMLGGSGEVKAPVVFAGYGLTVPKANYDDFKGLDVTGKVVVVLRRVPRWNNDATPFAGDQNAYQGVEAKIANAERRGAAAVLLVNDRSEADAGDPFAGAQGSIMPAGVPVAQVRRNLLDTMFVSGKGTTLAAVEQDIDRDLQPRSGPIPGWTANLTATIKRTTYPCKNIIAVLEGAGPLAKETVVVGAHYDHLGFGFGKLGKDQPKKIYPGADDNGSGSTTVVELARRFGAIKDRQGRKMVFMLFSAEERGLLGSRYYCSTEPLFPLETTVAMLNLDMVGRLNEKDPQLTAEGFDTGKGLREMLDKFNEDFGFKLVGNKGIFARSDQYSFYQKNIPAMFFFSGFHPDYHKQTDFADRINIAGMAKIAALSEKILAHLTTNARHSFIHMEPTGGGKGAVPKLKIGFDNDDTSDKGALISSVLKDGPGDKAGLLVGDRIVAINGKATPNFATYLSVLRLQKANVALELTVDRGGKTLKVTATPVP
jgi:hypothetical protein